jgi:hypothetical protein
MAISTDAKAFLASPVTQKVVNDIYSGRVVFSVTANRSILADNYKPRAIEIYNPHNSPFLNHYRRVLYFHSVVSRLSDDPTGSGSRNMALTLSFSILDCS